MKRFFALLSFVSLLVCVATCVLWVRSYFAYDMVVWTSQDGKVYRHAGSGLGVTSLYNWRNTGEDYLTIYGLPEGYTSLDVGHDATSVSDAASEALRNLVRFHYSHEKNAATQAVSVGFPLWVIALITAILPMWSLRRRRQLRRRHRQGLCPACGYDLRASPERCPECGAAPASRSTT